jgi:hypothetical protein
MTSESRSKSIMSAVLLASFVSMPGSASAITVEVAKTCNALITKQFPPRQIGNPAAGSAKGTGQAQRDFFNKCVANGGKMDGDGQSGSKP